MTLVKHQNVGPTRAARLDRVVFEQEHLDAVWAHAVMHPYEEVCGWMRYEVDTVVDVYQAENIAENKAARVEIDARELFAMNVADDNGDGIIFYHSHPGGPAAPSLIDVSCALYPHWLWLIVGVATEEVRLWEIGLTQTPPSGPSGIVYPGHGFADIRELEIGVA